jgi:hypothetical protein
MPVVEMAPDLDAPPQWSTDERGAELIAQAREMALAEYRCLDADLRRDARA